MAADSNPTDQPLLSPEELALLRSLFQPSVGSNVKGPPRIPLAKEAWGNQEALLTYLRDLGGMKLTAETGNCKMTFPLQLKVDEVGQAALHIEAPSLLERHPNYARKLRVSPSPNDIIRLADLNGRFTLPRIMNISVTGLCVADAFNIPPKIGEIVDGILLSLPGGINLELKAKVVRVDPAPKLGDEPPPTHSVALQLFEEADELEAYVFHRYWQNNGAAPEDDPFGSA